MFQCYKYWMCMFTLVAFSETLPATSQHEVSTKIWMNSVSIWDQQIVISWLYSCNCKKKPSRFLVVSYNKEVFYMTEILAMGLNMEVVGQVIPSPYQFAATITAIKLTLMSCCEEKWDVYKLLCTTNIVIHITCD